MENKKAFGHVLAIFTIFILLQQEELRLYLLDRMRYCIDWHFHH